MEQMAESSAAGRGARRGCAGLWRGRGGGGRGVPSSGKGGGGGGGAGEAELKLYMQYTHSSVRLFVRSFHHHVLRLRERGARLTRGICQIRNAFRRLLECDWW